MKHLIKLFRRIFKIKKHWKKRGLTGADEKEYQMKYFKLRYTTDPEFKEKHKRSSRIYSRRKAVDKKMTNKK